jgi:drug/metabolite transporter (DMT)-like permease
MILNLLFLGVFASAVCFTIWSMSVKAIGTITSIIYIYLSPALTVITAYIILGETITLKGFIGCVLVILGLFLSNKHLMNIITLKKLAK